MSGRIPRNIIETIRERINILDMVGAYVHLTQKGGRWWGLCPFHDEKTPSFSVNPDSNLFYCFGCQKGGGSYQFLMEIEGFSFVEAVQKLAQKAGVDIPQGSNERGDGDTQRILEELYRRVKDVFQWLLNEHKEAKHARTYLQNRGIDKKTAETYHLGWAPDDGEFLYRYLRKKKYTAKLLATSGLFSKKSAQWCSFVDRLIFPVMPDNERVVAFSGRLLSSGISPYPKYINSPETLLYRKRRHLYGLGQARKEIQKSGTALLCEGNIDVIAFHCAGIKTAIAPLGTSFTEEQARLIKRHAKNLVLAFDGDNAGRHAVMKIALLAEQKELKVSVLSLPQDRDPADFLASDKLDELKKILERSINIFDYLLDYLIGNRHEFSGEEQEEIFEKIKPYLDAVGPGIKRESYLSQLAEKIRVDPVTLLREYRAGRRPFRQDSLVSRRRTGLLAEDMGDELYLMTALAVRTEYFPPFRDSVSAEFLQDKRALALYRILETLSDGGGIPSTENVVEELKDDELKNFVLEKAMGDLYKEYAQETIDEKTKAVLTRAWEAERKELVEGLPSLDKADSLINQDRLVRIKEINEKIMKSRQGVNG